MTPEERSMLEETKALVKENNEILKSIRNMNRISAGIKVLYWVVILLVSFGAYYFIQPYIEALGGVYGDVKGSVETVKNLKENISNLGY